MEDGDQILMHIYRRMPALMSRMKKSSETKLTNQHVRIHSQNLICLSLWKYFGKKNLEWSIIGIRHCRKCSDELTLAFQNYLGS